MHHGRLQDMLDDMLEYPDELIITSNSKHYALVSLGEDSTYILQGDFSGTPEEREAEARRLLKDVTPRKGASNP